MNEWMYGINSGAIAVALLVSMALAMEIGRRIGLRSGRLADGPVKDHHSAMQGTVLGLLALILSFTFSLSLGRFDKRSEAVVDEANAIGTTYLRSQLVVPAQRAEIQALLREYLDLRIRSSSISLADRAQRAALAERASRKQQSLWENAVRAAKADPNTVTSGLFIQALNGMIDSFGEREAALTRHVPELVLMLLYATFLMGGAIMGYTAAAAGHRPSPVSYIMAGLIVVLIFLVLDLDRPHRGFIEVNQGPLIELQAFMAAGAVPAGGLRTPP